MFYVCGIRLLGSKRKFNSAYYSKKVNTIPRVLYFCYNDIDKVLVEVYDTTDSVAEWYSVRNLLHIIQDTGVSIDGFECFFFARM